MAKTKIGIALLVVVAALGSACGGESGGVASPVAPTASPPPPAISDVTMKGTVSDTVFRSLAGALVEVVSGPQTGLRTTSNGRGEFSFAGPFDDTSTFQASKDGFATATLPLGPYCERCRPNRWVHFGLATLVPAADISGDYDLTMTLGPGCTAMPDHVRTRTYQARIPPLKNGGNAYASVTVAGADFEPGWGGFEVGVAGSDVGLWAEILVEQVSPTNRLIFAVSAAGTVPGSPPTTINLVASGRITYCTLEAGGALADCYSSGRAQVSVCDRNDHSIVFRRR